MNPLFLEWTVACRQLRRSPGFTIAAALMLAFGIGATTAVFSIVEGVLLRPLPFPNSDRLVILSDNLQGTGADGVAEVGVTAPDIRAYSQYTHSYTSLGGYGVTTYELSGRDEPAQVNASRLTAGVFPALGVPPLLGRTFTAKEEEDSQLLAVLSYATWKNRFQGSPQVLGSTILLDRRPYLIIGVMPRMFEFPLMPGHVNRSELWVPMSLTPHELITGADSWKFQMVGRLKDGVTAAQAQGEADRVAQGIMRNYPAFMSNIRISSLVRSLQDDTVKDTRPLVRTLFLAVFVVLLIVCANLAGLLLVRAIRRQQEVALRLALGASTRELVRQVLLEGLVLSMFGGLLGVAMAAVALRLGKGLLPDTLPRVSEIGINWKVMAFGLALTIATGLLSGLAPAFAALRTSINDTLRGGMRYGSVGLHSRLRSALVVAEIATSLVLLTASGMLLISFHKMRSVDLGFRPEHITTAAYSLPQKQYATQLKVNSFNENLLSRLSHLPGIEAASLTNVLPTSGGENNNSFIPEGYLPPKGISVNIATCSFVLGDFFQALGTPLLHGRFFVEADRANTQLVVVVNRKLADHYWPQQDPVGKRLRIGTPEMRTPWLTIVGEVDNVKLSSPDADIEEQLYQPVEQVEASLGSLASSTDLNGNANYIILRSGLPSQQVGNMLRAATRSMDPQLPLTRIQSMDDVVSDSEGSRRFNTILITCFAGVAVLLAVLGVYAVTAFSVAMRAQEMAIRIALGSSRYGILSLVLTSAAKLAVLGSLIGIAGAVAASGLLRSLLFEVNPLDPIVMAWATFTLLILTLAASMLPAQRAASATPMQALRGE